MALCLTGPGRKPPFPARWVALALKEHGPGFTWRFADHSYSAIAIAAARPDWQNLDDFDVALHQRALPLINT